MQNKTIVKRKLKQVIDLKNPKHNNKPKNIKKN